ncbi:putative disease resistance RPP13-like protein 3 isoform X2 [Coffea eugenioides]|uniref:putative disease resistance RPP13-like protein 3 isoform X2 n=1 Tax=Coffea eugenioides TaxID=49369 RepID=UPI000F606401|nr:putative disease resistance RPP13-like protein 3 isoform X2 [Coffea eugenioides]
MANIPDAALGFILQNLKESVQYNAELIGGVKDNVKELCEDLETLRAFIREYTDKYSDNEILEKLASKIRGVVYRAEDAIETYISCASVQKLRRAISKAAHFVDYISDLRAVGKEIEKVSKDVQEIYQNRAALGFAAMQIEEISNRRQKKKKTPVVEEDNVVGFDDAAKEVIELLTGESDDQSDQLEVISIIGMLGLGKTTLAKKVLNDPKIEYEFYTRAFVNVSQEYERKEMFLKILGQFTQITDQMNKMSDEQLCKELHDQLKTRKYLIVMDDVWTNEAWDQLKGAFPNNNKRSRVLITSRHKPVAVHANQSIDPYFLRFLYPEESRELLRRKVFGNNCCPSELEAYELRILQKCDGLPLAIVVVAGILVNHRDRTDWWKKVAEDVNDYVARKQEQSYDVIKLSYNHMPYYLKPCFLYLGVFREDFEIPVWKLVRLWIAEGFIPRDGCMSLEDIAEDYLEELVDRNLVMVGHRRLTGQIKTCRIHDTLRDFCKKEATKENLFQEIKRKLTRLTLLNTLLDWKHMSTLGKLEKLEVLKLKDNAFQGELWRTEGGGFRNLKVLHIGSTNLVMWKALASHFPILRSLFLRHCTKLEAVPSGLGDIATLQEIDLYCTNSMVAKSARNIQVLKLKVQANDKNKRGAAFKLSVYPPDQ